MLQAVARALRLSDQERAHLFSLAGQAEDDRGRLPSRRVDEATAALLNRLTDTPALVMDNTCQVIAWNPLAAALFEDFALLRSADRNVLRRIFLHPDQGRGTYGITDQEQFVLTTVSYLRMATTRYPDDADLRALIADLLAGSEVFRRLWTSLDIRVDHHARQVFQHPQVGPIELDYDILSIPDRDQQVVLFTAEPDSRAFRDLQLLKVIGARPMVPSG
ncbi:hypothetical protein ABH920_003355 [Catenulispora sp. EB89]